LRARDLAIVAAVAVLGLFAVVDGIRSLAEREPETPPPAEQARTDSRRAEAEFRAARGPARFRRVRASGRIVFTDPADCRVRAVAVQSGEELPFRRALGNCELSAPARGRTIAYGQDDGGVSVTTFTNLSRHPTREWPHPVSPGGIVWSEDGRRAGWCGEDEAGFELEIGRRALRRLEACPLAYAPDGTPTYVVGNRLLLGRRTLLEAASRVDYAGWSANGSLVVVIHEGRLARWVDGEVTRTMTLPPTIAGQRPILSPDNCAALFLRGSEVRLVDLGCFQGRSAYVTISPDNCRLRRERQTAACLRSPTPRTFPGTTAAWSPDGRWIAVADEGRIVFHRVVGRYDTVRWPAAAAALAWQA
jgi:hypothetical protein